MTRPTMPNEYPQVPPTAPPSFPEAVLTELRATGADIDVSVAGRADHGRDWWPRTIATVHNNEVPSWPGAVARPHSTAEVAALVLTCAAHQIAITPQGGRSGVVGGAMPATGALALDLTAMDDILSMEPEVGRVRVQAGIFGPDLERALREVGQTVGHFPQSFDLATVGGWMATRGAGQFSNRYGNAADIVRGLTVVLANGDIVTIGGRAPVESVGPDLLQLFVGSEGTLGVITEVELVTHDIAPARAQAAYRFDTFAQGLEACRIMARRGALPAVARLYDEIETQRSLGAEGCGLIILDEGTADQVAATMAVVFDACASATPLDESLVDHWLGHRNNVSSLAPLWEKGYVVDTVEVAGTWDQLPALHEAVVSALRDIPGVRNASVHQSHAYPDGACLYFTFAGEPGEQSADAFYRACWDAASHATMACGASLSHHHGVGRNRAPYVEAALGTSFGLLSSIKHALDPQNIMNPGVLGFSS